MGLKNAWEISMEKAASMDSRGEEELTLTQEQKAKIAEARKTCEAKIAEKEIMMQNKIREVAGGVGIEGGFEYVQNLKEEFNRDKRMSQQERDKRIEEIKKRS